MKQVLFLLSVLFLFTSAYAQNKEAVATDNPESQNPVPVHPQQEPLPVVKVPVKQQPENDSPRKPSGDGQLSFIPMLDRESVIRFINESGFLTYVVRSVKINSYLKSLLSLAGLLTQNLIYPNANDEVTK